MKKAYTFNHNPLLSDRLPEWRARVVLVALLTGSVVLSARAMYLQGVNKDFLQQKGESRYARTLVMPANRGKVTDRHGELLAVSTPVKSIAAITDMAQLDASQIAALAKTLGMNPAEISKRLASKRDFVYLKREVPPDEAARVANLKLPGIQEQEESRRFYPVGEVASHLIGFTDVDDKGQEGIELALQSELVGQPGSRRVIRNRRGEIVEDVESIRQPQDGKDVPLALDAKIQYLAYSALKQAVDANKAKAGAAVVLDAKTGEILALVNEPTYNPNNRVKLTGEQVRNRAFTDSYEPGSIMKPFVISMALESHRYRPDTIIDTNGGHLTINGATIGDSHAHGALTVSQVIQKSSNIGTAKIALTFPPEQMWQLYNDLGFGQPLKMGFPGEVGGRMRPYKTWRPIEQATMSYGHGISVTLVQLAHAYLAFARDGDLIPLSLTRVDSPPMHGKQVFSPEVVKQMRLMLESVVGEGGTAQKAAVPGYRVGGKTGTAYKLENGHYVRRYVASFVGVAPMSNPRVVVAVMLDDPLGGQHFGGDVAGPAFSQIMGSTLRWMGVSPDAPIAPTQVARVGKSKENM
ncbi:peptidoglycan D,D-transpeptidase FtsI family protein [Uliginosibacterium gangwonense]|uniref:peptidoglycan D,D-transpeptidase FtsI family protein n=1 Tax=Uliginosibacterium gangwonense TaxID=392736 RepID=UPI00036CF638|nr:penicillin-binding protein 2 [Uliginosibacterium gangwonense]